MASIAVEIVLEKLASLASQEARLVVGVRARVHQLRDDLESMRSFLQDAESRSGCDDQVLKTWVKQVRDVAYDAQDVIEEFLLHLAPPRRPGFIHFASNFYHHIRQFKTRHKLAVQIESIKERVKAISDRRTAFSFNTTSSNASLQLQTWHDPRRASLYIDECDIVGIENPKSSLLTWLVEGERKLTTISVVGMGGLGKTTVAKKAFDSEAVKRSFDCYAWVTVSKSFTIAELLRAALLDFLKAAKEPAPEGIESMVDFQLVELLKSYLEQKRYVIVLDDIWSSEAWEAVRYALPDCNCGSRIMFTTRLNDLGASVEHTGHYFPLQPLPEKEAWILFCKKALRGEREGVFPEELEALSQSILKKCEGLPLAIVAIGGLLSKKKRAFPEWKKVHDSLAAEMASDCSLGSLERILLLSYNDLPYNLKLCYLYLSVFPEDYLINSVKLIKLWVAERFVEEKQGLTKEEVAEDYFNELVNRNLIQVVELDHFRRVRTCRIHDLLRDIIQMKSSQESLVMIVNKKSMAKSSQKVRRVSVHGSCDDSMSKVKFPYLLSFLVFKSGSTTLFRDSLFSSFRLLRLLDLELAPLTVFPSEVVELVHLRYLSLRRTKIKDIPDSIRKLKYLEVLDLRGTNVSSLPIGILKLIHLSQLLLYSYRYETCLTLVETYGMKVPTRIGKLTSLQKLSCVEVNGDGELVRELGKLTKLRRLGILELSKEHGWDLCYSLEKMRHLTSLYMVSEGAREYFLLDSMSSPPQFLQRLYLKGRLARLPKWIASLQYLTKLVLQHSNLETDPLNALQRLPSLVVLDIREVYNGEELCCEAGGYPQLKKLSLYQMEKLKKVKLGEGAMPGLRELKIAACQELATLPLGIEQLHNLKEMLLVDMPRRFCTRMKSPDGEDYWKIQHIPTILQFHESRGRWAIETLSDSNCQGTERSQDLPLTWRGSLFRENAPWQRYTSFGIQNCCFS